MERVALATGRRWAHAGGAERGGTCVRPSPHRHHMPTCPFPSAAEEDDPYLVDILMNWRKGVKTALVREMEALTVVAASLEDKGEEDELWVDAAKRKLMASRKVKAAQSKDVAEAARQAMIRREREHPILVPPEWNYMFALDSPARALDVGGEIMTIDINCRRSLADRVRSTFTGFRADAAAVMAASNFTIAAAPYPTSLLPYISREEFSGLLSDLRCIYVSGLSYSAARNYLALVVTRRLMHTRGVAVFLYQVRSMGWGWGEVV